MLTRKTLVPVVFLAGACGFSAHFTGPHAFADPGQGQVPDCVKADCKVIVAWWVSLPSDPTKFIEKGAPNGCYAYHEYGISEPTKLNLDSNARQYIYTSLGDKGSFTGVKGNVNVHVWSTYDKACKGANGSQPEPLHVTPTGEPLEDIEISPEFRNQCKQ